MCTSFVSKLSCLPSGPPSPAQLPIRPIRSVPPLGGSFHHSNPVASLPRSGLNPLTFSHPLTSTPRCPLCGAYICHNLPAAIIVPCVHWTCMSCFERHTDAKLGVSGGSASAPITKINVNSNTNSNTTNTTANIRAPPSSCSSPSSATSFTTTSCCSTAFDTPPLFDTTRTHRTCPIARCSAPVTSFWPATAESLEEEVARLEEHQAVIRLQRRRRREEEEEQKKKSKKKNEHEHEHEHEHSMAKKPAGLGAGIVGLGEVLQLGKGAIFGNNNNNNNDNNRGSSSSAAAAAAEGSGSVAGSRRRDTDASMLTGTATHCSSTGSDLETKVVKDVRKTAVRVDGGLGAVGEKVAVVQDLRAKEGMKQMGVVSYMRERRAAKEALMKEG